MTRVVSTLALFMFLILLGYSLKAEENKPDKKTRIVFRKEESHKFSGSKLKGKLKKPEISYIYQRKGLRQEKVVNIPENFDAEIIHTAEKL